MIHLVTGGTSSGKSSFAEQLACTLGDARFYVATMEPHSAEARERIARHRKLRAEKRFETVERQRDLAGLALPPAAAHGVVLLEDIGNLAANELFGAEPFGAEPFGAEPFGDPESESWEDLEGAFERIMDGIAHLNGHCSHLVVVTCEVGSAGRPTEPGMRSYTALIGRVNCTIAAQAATVHECVASIARPLKGGYAA